MEDSDFLERNVILAGLDNHIVLCVYRDKIIQDDLNLSVKDYLENLDESVDAVCCPLKKRSDGSSGYDENDFYLTSVVILSGGAPVDVLIASDNVLSIGDFVYFRGYLRNVEYMVVADYYLYIEKKTSVSVHEISNAYWIYHLIPQYCDNCSYILRWPSFPDVPDDYEELVSHTHWQVRSAFQEDWDHDILYDSGVVDDDIAHGTPDNLLEHGGYIYYYRMRYQDKKTGDWSPWSDDQFLTSTRMPLFSGEAEDDSDIEVSEEDLRRLSGIVATDERFKFAKNKNERMTLACQILSEAGINIDNGLVVGDDGPYKASYIISKLALEVYDTDILPRTVLKLKSLGFTEKNISIRVGRSLSKVKAIITSEKG